MPRHIVDFPPLIPTTTGANSVTNVITGFEGCDALMVYVSSSANAASTGTTLFIQLQVSQIDPNMVGVGQGISNSRSTAYQVYTIKSTTGGTQLFSTGAAVPIEGSGFRSLRLVNFTSATAGEPVAWVSAVFSV